MDNMKPAPRSRTGAAEEMDGRGIHPHQAARDAVPPQGDLEVLPLVRPAADEASALVINHQVLHSCRSPPLSSAPRREGVAYPAGRSLPPDYRRRSVRINGQAIPRIPMPTGKAAPATEGTGSLPPGSGGLMSCMWQCLLEKPDARRRHFDSIHGTQRGSCHARLREEVVAVRCPGELPSPQRGWMRRSGFGKRREVITRSAPRPVPSQAGRSRRIFQPVFHPTCWSRTCRWKSRGHSLTGWVGSVSIHVRR
jgi:hypothetical protein